MKSLSLAILVVMLAGLATLAPGLGGSTRPSPAQANVNCSNTYRLRVDIVDDDTGTLLGLAGARVRISPDPMDGSVFRIYIDNGVNDDNPTVGRIDESDACEVNSSTTPGPDVYTIRVTDLPSGCVLVGDDTQTRPLISNGSVTFHVQDCNAPPPATNTVSVFPVSGIVPCGGSTGIGITVRTGSANAPDGTTLGLSTNFGVITPTSTTTTNGGAFATFFAPNSNGVATITATALGVSGTANVQVSCGGGGSTAPAQLNFPATSCGGAVASVTFSWTAVTGSFIQFLDLSIFDNGFAPATFLGFPASSTTSQLTLNGVLAGHAHFWRINALTPAGWVTSATGAFVPCGPAHLRGTTYSCTGGGRATVNFFWAPSSPPGFVSFLDLSIFNNGFAPATFINSFLEAGRQQGSWLQILANTPHWWRVNTLFTNGWVPSPTGFFFAAC